MDLAKMIGRGKRSSANSGRIWVKVSVFFSNINVSDLHCIHSGKRLAAQKAETDFFALLKEYHDKGDSLNPESTWKEVRDVLFLPNNCS